MLPELPFSLILHLVDIIMGYPIRIIVKACIVQIFLLELVICIKDRLDMILILYNMQPSEYISLEIFCTPFFRLMLDIQYRGQVSCFQLYILEEMLCLLASRCLETVEMICASDETMLTRFMEIVYEILVYDACALCRLYYDETYGATVYIGRA